MSVELCRRCGRCGRLCPRIVEASWDEHGPEQQAGAAEWEQGYRAIWRRLSKQFLRQAENALCVMCEAEGQTRPAEVVDQVILHKGDQALFCGPTNWHGLCKSHHSRDKQAEERGFSRRRRIRVGGYLIE